MPPLVHISGVGMSGTYMLPTADRLAAKWQTLVPDLPGVGRSTGGTTTATIESLADGIRDLLDSLEIPRAVLVGNSMGCMTVLEFAHRYPNRIACAVLCSPGRPVYRPLARGIAQHVRLLWHEPMSMLPILLHDYYRCGFRNGYSLYQSMIAFPTARRMIQVEVPTLIVLGDLDPFASVSEVERLASRKSNLQVVTVKGGRHTLNYSHPTETVAAISDFLETVCLQDVPNASKVWTAALESANHGVSM